MDILFYQELIGELTIGTNQHQFRCYYPLEFPCVKPRKAALRRDGGFWYAGQAVPENIAKSHNGFHGREDLVKTHCFVDASQTDKYFWETMIELSPFGSEVLSLLGHSL